MKKTFIVIFLFITSLLNPAENENLLISEIIVKIENYKNNTLSLNLRLKYVDRLFEKIVFYDSENAMYYRDRSNFKSQNGDKLGACEDLKKAVELGGESIAISKYDYDNLCK